MLSNSQSQRNKIALGINSLMHKFGTPIALAKFNAVGLGIGNRTRTRNPSDYLRDDKNMHTLTKKL